MANLHIVKSAKTIILQNLSSQKKRLFLQKFVYMKIQLIQVVMIIQMDILIFYIVYVQKVIGR